MNSESLDQLLQSGNISVTVDLNTLRRVIRETVASLQPPDDPATDKYLTSEQTADLLSVDRSTLYRWEKKGILTPCKAGGVVRYREKDIQKLMQKDTDD